MPALGHKRTSEPSFAMSTYPRKRTFVGASANGGHRQATSSQKIGAQPNKPPPQSPTIFGGCSRRQLLPIGPKGNPIGLRDNPIGPGNNVRFGSKADISQCNRHVRFTPESIPLPG